VTVDYGFDLHTISISEAAFAQIQTGKLVTVQGQGFPVEGTTEQDRWTFNESVPGAIYVSTDEGRDVFEGHLGDAEVAVQGLEEG
jgi:hypothetical protein